MRKSLQVISLLALLMTIVPPILFLAGSIDLNLVKLLMSIAAVVWFVVTPFWMGKRRSA